MACATPPHLPVLNTGVLFSLAQVVHWAAFYEARMVVGAKEIFHLEAFVAKFMSVYKQFLINLFAWRRATIAIKSICFRSNYKWGYLRPSEARYKQPASNVYYGTSGFWVLRKKQQVDSRLAICKVKCEKWSKSTPSNHPFFICSMGYGYGYSLASFLFHLPFKIQGKALCLCPYDNLCLMIYKL